MDLPAASSKEPKGIGLEDTSGTKAAEDQVDAQVQEQEGGGTPGGGNGSGSLSKSLSPIAQHELDPEERKTAHRLVATGMLVTIVVIGLSQNWWQHLRDWITEKTHGPAQAAKPGG